VAGNHECTVASHATPYVQLEQGIDDDDDYISVVDIVCEEEVVDETDCLRAINSLNQ